MKNIILIAFIATIAVCNFTGCEKENATHTQQNLLQPKTDPYGTVVFSIQLHRLILQRPRDHKYCNCLNCFGLCKAEVFPDIHDALEQLNQVPYPITDQHHSLVALQIIDNNNALLLFLENKDAFEEEFVVDNSVEVPSVCLKQSSGSTYKNIIIREGVYSFHNTSSSLSLYGKTIKTYGYVELEITCE